MGDALRVVVADVLVKDSTGEWIACRNPAAVDRALRNGTDGILFAIDIAKHSPYFGEYPLGLELQALLEGFPRIFPLEPLGLLQLGDIEVGGLGRRVQRMM